MTTLILISLAITIAIVSVLLLVGYFLVGTYSHEELERISAWGKYRKAHNEKHQ